MTAYVEGHKQNEEKAEIDMLRYDRKLNYQAHGEESVAAWAQ